MASYDIPLYHWSPRDRRKQIIRYGLRPKMISSSSIEWKPPYICLAETPSWAWALSGANRKEILEWDLWETSLKRLGKYKILKSYDHHRFHEVRSFERIYKRDLWYVGSRTQLNNPTQTITER